MKIKSLLIPVSAFILSVSVTGCGTSHAPTVQKPNPNPNLVNSSASLSAENGSKANGIASLTLDKKTNQLTVVVELSGLAPNSTHPEHIHSGTCQKTGPVVEALNDLKAGPKGEGTSMTVINNVKALPKTGWVINVHAGSSAGNPQTPIACGEVTGS